MTRQSRARALAFATFVLVVVLAAVFALLRNLHPFPAPPQSAPPSAAAQRVQPQSDSGRAAFERLGCVSCHAAEGRGNAALPLDGIGGRRSREELRASAFGQVPSRVARTKQELARDPEAEAVLDYLQQLR